VAGAADSDSATIQRQNQRSAAGSAAEQWPGAALSRDRSRIRIRPRISDAASASVPGSVCVFLLGKKSPFRQLFSGLCEYSHVLAKKGLT